MVWCGRRDSRGLKGLKRPKGLKGPKRPKGPKRLETKGT